MADNFCEQCGARLAPDARFCEVCGNAVVTPPTPVIQPPMLVPTPQQAPQSTRPSRTGLYILIGAAAIVAFVVLMILTLKPGKWFKQIKETTIDSFATEIFQIEDAGSIQEEDFLPTIDTPPSASSAPIQAVSTDRDVFHCISSDGPTTLTISVNTDPGVTELALRWRLNTKIDGQLTEWEGAFLDKISSNQFSYTFNADTWGGTNNFYYPPLLGESWFEFQIFLPDGTFQTKIFTDITFFPCAQ
jgi:hypothetical protein